VRAKPDQAGRNQRKRAIYVHATIQRFRGLCDVLIPKYLHFDKFPFFQLSVNPEVYRSEGAIRACSIQPKDHHSGRKH
jgi:hypothetical protein